MKYIFTALLITLVAIASSGCMRFHHSTDPSDTTKTQRDSSFAIKLNGHSSYLQVPSTKSLQLCDSSYTIETWVYYNYFGGDWQVILAKDNTDYNTEWLLTADGPTGKFRFQTRDFSTVLYSTELVQAKKWYHIAAVQDIQTSTVKLYINGELEATSNLYGRLVATDYPIRIGTRINDITQGNPWYVVNGLIDEIRIWNVAKTSAELQASMNHTLGGTEDHLVAYWNFNEGNGTYAIDHSGNDHTAEFIGGPEYSVSTAPAH